MLSSVIVVGSANQDLVSYASRVPSAGETVRGSSFETFCGGKGANQAVAAAAVGGRVTMVCRVGDDAFGRALLANFDARGVAYDTSTVTDRKTATGVAAITVEATTGENRIVVCAGANASLTPEHVRTALSSSSSIAAPKVVLVQLEINLPTALEALTAAKAAHGGDVTTVLNPAPATADLPDDFLTHADIVVPNEHELKILCHDDDDTTSDTDGVVRRRAESLLQRGVTRAVVVTLGARGAMVVEKNSDGGTTDTVVRAPSSDHVKVVDTTGAGDAFCGALASYLAHDDAPDLVTACAKACRVASLSVTKKGAQSSYPTTDELPQELVVESSSTSPTMTTKPTITFVTGNPNKVEELRRLLLSGNKNDSDVVPYHITNQKLDLPELQGDDPRDIAIAKCKMAAKLVEGPVLVEDTSLCFHALHGLPGPYIKWFLEGVGHDGLNDMLVGFQGDNRAYAQTIFSLCLNNNNTTDHDEQDVLLFVGRTEGTIVRPRGDTNFGWDPVFEPEGSSKTYAEMDKDEKNAVSHRGRAFQQLKEYLLVSGTT